jgi:citrate lyase subunit beta/citryl-CoA lyase
MPERTRSWLFAPADRPDRCLKALAGAADQVIWDLEDAVAPEAKEEARRTVRELLRQTAGEPRVPWIRVNGLFTPWGPEDLLSLQDAVSDARARWLVPKADARTVGRLEAWRREGKVRGQWLLLVETARGLDDLARAERPWLAGDAVRLAFGALDYQADLGAGPVGPDEAELAVPRHLMARRSRVFGWPAPIDAVYPGYRDPEGLRAAAERARRFGFAGKMVIHPDQIGPVHEAFTPTAEERAWAERVLAASRAGGVATVDGAMVDRPVVERARQILAFFDEGDG